MSLYVLSYDLRKQRNYDALYDEFIKFKAIQILESVWCFEYPDATAAALRDYFADFIDSDDGLLVAKMDGWATRNTNGTPKDLK